MKMCKVSPKSLPEFQSVEMDNNVYWYVVGETIDVLTPVLYLRVFMLFFRNDIWGGSIWEAMNEGPVR